MLVPRTHLAELVSRLELKRTGIYCLVGPDPNRQNRDRVYVGEGDNVLDRLTKHDNDSKKDFWIKAAVVTSKDDNLTKAHVRYLESRLIEKLMDSGRAEVANGNTPFPKTMPEPDVADMEYFLGQVEMVFPVLGLGFLQPKLVQELSSEKSPKFIISDVGTNATAYEIDGEFVVLKGSTARKIGVPSWESYVGLRNQLVEDGKLVDHDESYYKFADDVLFSSPSAAAAVVAARNTNGRMSWKIEKTGQTYNEWKQAVINAAKTTADHDNVTKG